MNKIEVERYFIDFLNRLDEVNCGLISKLVNCDSGDDLECHSPIELWDAMNQIMVDFPVGIDYGQTKLVITSFENNEIARNYVIKMPFGNHYKDHCAIEVSKYDFIYNNYNDDMIQMFAECWRAEEKFNKEKPMYFMQRALCSDELVEEKSYKYYLSTGGEPEEYYPEDQDEEVINCFNLAYGEDNTEYLRDIMIEIDNNDIHDKNIGFINDLPVFIDYSGFYRK